METKVFLFLYVWQFLFALLISDFTRVVILSVLFFWFAALGRSEWNVQLGVSFLKGGVIFLKRSPRWAWPRPGICVKWTKDLVGCQLRQNFKYLWKPAPRKTPKRKVGLNLFLFQRLLIVQEWVFGLWNSVWYCLCDCIQFYSHQHYLVSFVFTVSCFSGSSFSG